MGYGFCAEATAPLSKATHKAIQACFRFMIAPLATAREIRQSPLASVGPRAPHHTFRILDIGEQVVKAGTSAKDTLAYPP
jgi:hypothetical protein